MKKEQWGKAQRSSFKLLAILGYLPPAIFIILSFLVSFHAAIIIDLLFSIALAALRSREGNLVINAVFPVFFSVLIVVLYAFPEQAGILMSCRGALVWGAYAAMAFASLFVRNPFTLQHAKEQVIDAVLDSPVFISVNYVLTGIFATVFLTNMIMNAIWEDVVAVHLVSFGLLVVAGLLTKVLPARYVPWYMKRHGAEAMPKDLSKLPLSMIFQGMNTRFDAEEAKSWDTVIQYIITGNDGGKFYMKIKNQKSELFEGQTENPELTITASRDDWVSVAEGKLEGTRAFMEGKMKAEGNMNDLIRMQKVFLTEDAGLHKGKGE
jgi:putative sterol carrier protein